MMMKNLSSEKDYIEHYNEYYIYNEYLYGWLKLAIYSIIRVYEEVKHSGLKI